MNNLNFQQSIVFASLLTSLNTDQGVNYGCNLKWKLADKSEFGLATIANFKNKQVSKPLI